MLILPYHWRSTVPFIQVVKGTSMVPGRDGPPRPRGRKLKGLSRAMTAASETDAVMARRERDFMMGRAYLVSGCGQNALLLRTGSYWMFLREKSWL